jgi:lipopolysaccharide export system protein LptA
MPQTKQRPRPNRAAASTSGGTLLPRAGFTLLTAVALGVLFLGYCAATRSLRAQPPQTRHHQDMQQQAPAGNEDLASRMARQYLPHQTWAASAKNQGSTVDKSTFWYFQVWKQESETVIRLEPFALVSKRKDAKPGDRPYSVASDKAYITFASKVSLLGGNPGAVVRAELEGAVQIEGPNNLCIDGRNFYYQKGDPNVVYSDDPLRFRADRHFGSAKGMYLELLRNEKAKPDEPMAIGGISSVKLLQNVDMTLVSDSFEQTMAPPTAAPAKAPRSKGSPDHPAQPVRCQSVGSFTFLMATHEATFERNVRIRRETAPAKFDRSGRQTAAAQFDFISADDSVKIVFDLKKPASPSASSPAKDQSPPASGGGGTFDSNLSFKEIHAHGKEVSLVSQSNGLKALMHDLDYDRTARQAKLSAVPNRVRILHHDDRLSAPFIQLDHDESGQEITQVWCRGEGDMKHVDEKTKEVDLTADWKKEMRKHPDPKSSFDLVELEEAMIEQPKEASGIAADHISLYLVRQNAQQRAARPNMPPAPKRVQSGPQLDHMVAWQRVEKVAMVSRQLEAESKRLEIWFQDGPTGPPKVDDGRPRLRANLEPTSKWVANADPATDTAAPSLSSPKLNAAAPAKKPSKGAPSGGFLPQSGESAEPYVMKADEIYVRVIRGAPDAPAQVANVISKGSVHLTQAQRDGAEPLVVDGDVLEVQNRGPLDQVMVVHGQPAHVRNRGAHIEGSRIVFDRAKNTADVDGAGRLQLPVKQSPEAGRHERALPFDVNWLSKMHFDGTTAMFTGSVRSKMDDGEEKTEVRCRQMGVTLNKPFSFSQEHKDQEQPEVECIDCYGGVEFDSDSTLDDKLMEVRRGVFAQLHFDKPSGKSLAHGPGLLRVWRHNENGQSGLSQFSNVQSNSPPKARKTTDWEYMQVKFIGRMNGDFKQMMAPPPGSKQPSVPRHEPSQPSLARRRSRGPAGAGNSILGPNGAWTTVFHDHVEVLYGPVDQPMETVSRDALIDQSGWLGCETLRVDQHPQSQTKDQFVTLLASGNSQIEGKDFFGEAETISYDGSKTLYVLRGDGNRLARLWRQLKVGGDSSNSDSNQIFFDPTHNIVHQDAVQKLDWIQ